jgi:catechol 2,3-dioxygenase-like lactoylglutathione lyase family enzyme
MLHHVSLGTNDLKRARRFYDPVLAELGVRLLKESERLIAYGLTECLFSLELPRDGKPASPGNGVHVAFHAGHRSAVKAAYEAGIRNGGSNDGAPGIRGEYDGHYFAAFLRDPDGNKIEVVTFAAQ